MFGRTACLAALLVVAFGCPALPRAGGACQPSDAVTCDSAHAVLACVSGAWRVVPCAGARGCVAAASVSCDTSAAAAGTFCPPWLEGTKTCHAAPSGVLQCADGVWQRLTACERCDNGACVSGGSGGGSATGCSPSTCATGCCTSNGQCLTSPLNASNSLCGTGGAACADCAASNQRCDGATLRCIAATSCSAATCVGCCANGQCVEPPSNTVAASCGTGGNACSDCGKLGLVCNPTTFSCSSSAAGGGGGSTDPCHGVPVGGRCLSSTLLQSCTVPTGAGSPTLQTAQCPSGASCEPTGAGAACVPAAGSCSTGDSRCTSPTSVQFCDASGSWLPAMTCAGGCVASAIGGDCGVALPTTTITATLTYETRAPLANLTDWGPATVVPAPHVFIASQRNTTWVDTTVTGADGRFTIKVPTTPNADDHVFAIAYGGDGLGLRYQVADPQLGAGVQQPGQPITNPRVWSWSIAASSLTPGATLTITTAQGSGALNLFDVQQQVWAQSLRLNQGRQGRSVVAWLGLGTEWTCGACFAPFPEAGFESQLWMPGGATDQGYWSDSTIAHELGHWEMASYGTSPSEGGPHYIQCPTFPGQAWSEGFATWHSAATRQTARFEDKQRGAFFWFDLGSRAYYPDSNGMALFTPAAGISCTTPACASGQVDENLVAAILWSISSARPSGMGEIFNAVASTHLNTSPWPRGYTRHTWNVSATSCMKINVQDTGQASLHLADALDVLRCGGEPAGSNATPATTLTTATVTGSTTWYPFPVNAPSCRNSVCYGCASGSTCSAGTTPTACGTGGVACVECDTGQTCSNGVCQ